MINFNKFLISFLLIVITLLSFLKNGSYYYIRLLPFFVLITFALIVNNIGKGKLKLQFFNTVFFIFSVYLFYVNNFEILFYFKSYYLIPIIILGTYLLVIYFEKFETSFLFSGIFILFFSFTVAPYLKNYLIIQVVNNGLRFLISFWPVLLVIAGFNLILKN